MKKSLRLRILIDCCMLILLPLLMLYSLIGEAIHEWLGVIMGALFICHHALNRSWFKSLTKGRYSARRILGNVVDLLLFADMLSLFISGIIISRHVFAFLGIGSGIALGFARTAHLFASYWGLLIMSFHTGTHGAALMGIFRNVIHIKAGSTIRTVTLRLIAMLLCIAGILAFLNRDIWTYLTLQNQFVFFDFSEPLAAVLADYLLIMSLFVILGYYIAILLTFSGRDRDRSPSQI